MQSVDCVIQQLGRVLDGLLSATNEQVLASGDQRHTAVLLYSNEVLIMPAKEHGRIHLGNGDSLFYCGQFNLSVASEIWAHPAGMRGSGD